MMGWVWILVFAGVVLLALWKVGRIGRQGMELATAAMLVALAGYGWWGNPGLAGSATDPAPAKAPDLSEADIKKAESGQFSSEGNVMMLTDAMIRAGATKQAAGVFEEALKTNPNSADLWVGYGNVLVIHGGGMINPAATYAFEKAAQISPNHPGPPFFMGLALAQGGKMDEAGEVWRALLARAPAGAEWVADLKTRLEEIGQMPVAGAAKGDAKAARE